jgi:osmotically-inducible protein OsmY
MRRIVIASMLLVGLCGTAAVAQQPQKTPGETVGEKIERGVSRVKRELSATWAQVRKSVEGLSVQGRVYGRLHWDKDLADATLDIDVRDTNVIVLKGSVNSAGAKSKAVQLAQDTLGVKEVVDELAVAGK